MKKCLIFITLAAIVTVISLSIISGSANSNDEELEKLNYRVRTDYTSYAEVATDKYAFFEYKKIYHRKLLRYLGKVEGSEGYEYKKQVENELRYDYRVREIEDEFNKQLALFEPSENDKLKSKEELLDYYCYVINSEPILPSDDDPTIARQKSVQDTVDAYKAGQISIDDALFRSGCVDLLKNVLSNLQDEEDRYYHYLLSQFNMSTWFDLDTYIADYQKSGVG